MKEIYRDFIGIYENAFSKEYCQYLINLGKKNISNAKSRAKSPDNLPLLIFDDLSFNLSEYIDQNTKEHFYNTVSNLIKTYIEKYKCLEYITSSGYNITDFKYQITKPSQGYHTWHCEYDASIPKTNLRWGVWTFYLNDVEEGGETEFLYQSYRLKPKTGTFSIFPAYYTHTHRGNPPISNTKHIITGWIEYPPEFVNKNEKNDSKRNT